METDQHSPSGTGEPPGGPAPAWLDASEYPFDSHWFQTGSGWMHFLDEGHGRPVVFVHGNPTWSFQFRTVIKELRPTHRCIAPDHLGFGLSDRPAGFSYLPADQARTSLGSSSPWTSPTSPWWWVTGVVRSACRGRWPSRSGSRPW